MSSVAPTLEAFFTERLGRQRQASRHTIASYRDGLRLLVQFAHQRTGVAPSRLDFADLDATLIGAFLDHLEQYRGSTVRTRNVRLAAIHSLFRFAALRHPEHAASSNEYSTSAKNATTATTSRSSPTTRSTRSCQPRTATAESDDATMPC